MAHQARHDRRRHLLGSAGERNVSSSALQLTLGRIRLTERDFEGAEILLYPSANGSEPYDATLDTHRQWQRAMQGHAVSNAVPVVAANRIGLEENDGASQRFYGHSFIADHRGEIVADLGET